MEQKIIVRVANASDVTYAQTITDEMESSAKARGIGIAKRTPAYVAKKMEEGKAVIATTLDGTWAGFCYIEIWGHGKYVAHSGLIVAPDFRGKGLARKIKKEVFELSLEKYPKAKVFGITTGMPVMKINYEFGYKPVHFSELTDDPEFWKGCQTCKNYDVLQRTTQSMCLCTGMLYDPSSKHEVTSEKVKEKTFLRLKSIKQSLFLKKHKK